MKKQILIIVLIGIIGINFNTISAQNHNGKQPPQKQVDELTEAQIETVVEILADYDSNSLTESDAKAIMKAIRDSKIPGGKGVENAINNAGFDFEEIRKLDPPPSRPGGNNKRN